jgi:hypothetical protein
LLACSLRTGTLATNLGESHLLCCLVVLVVLVVDHGCSSFFSSQLFVYQDAGKVSDITKEPKELFETALQKCISLRGNNMYQNFKMTKLTPGSAGNYLNGQSYMLADFKYQLLTGAGFEVDRKGVASITSTGDSVQVLWAASTTNRFKKTEANLRDIVDSFRCYADGINFSDELYIS